MDQPLVYPYVPDYHVAMLVGAGSSFHFSLFVPGTLLSASFVFLLFALAARLSGSVSSGLLSVPITVLTGGVGGFIWLVNDGTWWGMRSKDHVLYFVGSEDNACWFSLIAHILFPQRTTQYAYTITLIGLIVGTTLQHASSP